MSYLKNLFNKITAPIFAKKYTGIFDTGSSLPSSKQTVWDGSDFLNANEISLYVNRAIDKRAEKISEIEWYITDAKGNRIENDPLIDLLYKPNKVFTGREFWKLYQKYYDLVGEVYIYVERNREFGEKEKRPTALHLLMPTAVKPVFNADGSVQKYELKAGSVTKDYLPEDIIYIHNPNPKNPLRGISLLAAGVNSIQTEVRINQYQSNVLENGGKVEGVFSFKTTPLTQEQLQELKARYQKEYGQAKKAGMPLFLGGDANYTRTGMTPDELSYLEAKKMTFSDICTMTGVPEPLLSMRDVKYDNADAARTIFLSETIKPLVESLRTTLDEKLAPKDKNLKYVDPTPENVDQKLKIRENGIKNYYMTINEAREDAGLDPVVDGDKILVPSGLTELGVKKEEKDNKSKKKANTEESEHPLKDPEIREVYKRVQIKKADKREKEMAKILNEYFKDQEQRVIQNLGGEKSNNKNAIDDALNINLEVNIGKEKFVPFLLGVLAESGSDAMDIGGSNYEFNITAEIRTWLDNKADIFLNTINTTTLRQLQNQFSDSLSAGESRDDLVKRIRNTYEDISEARARTIARTELHSVTQYGNYKGYKQAGMVTKIWVTVTDSATRGNNPEDEADHLALDGEEVPIDTPFSNGLMYPGEVGAPAAEVINCRCQI